MNNTHESYASSLSQWLSKMPPWVLTVFAMVAAFAAYTSMYGFRKPFSAAGYKAVPDIIIFGTAFGYKGILVISQIFGYMLSKFMGIKFASEATYKKRILIVLGLILAAEVSLLLFAVVPAPYNIICIFANGLPLGMVWSMIFGVLEGRRVTEVLGLGMSIAIIFASGWTKSVATYLMKTMHVPEFWMPVATGAVFIPLLLISLFMLQQVPPPTAEDIKNRVVRKPMDRAARRHFIREYFIGIALLLVAYLIMMAFRDLRDSFMLEFLQEQKMAVDGSTFAMVETWVGVIVLVAMMGFAALKNHRTAVWLCLAFVSAGSIMVGLSLRAFEAGAIGPVALLILLGVGVYIGFVPYQAILFERLLASLKTGATVAFLIVLADAYGYLSTTSLYL